MEEQTDATIEAEIRGLAERYRLTSLDGLVRSINERLKRNPYASTIYLLTNPRVERVVGNLDRWPSASPGADGWVEFRLEQIGGQGERHLARARIFTLAGGFRLLVGRDMHELHATQALIGRTLIWGMLITVLLALLGGLMLSRTTVRRLEAINSTSREIMRGDLSRRIPTYGTRDDFDQLAENLNEMLDRIQQLMDGVRHVTDNIAHDLKTPLTRLRTRLESLSGGDRLDGDEIEQALAEADGMLATFNALLRIARIEAGARREAFELLDLVEVLVDVVDLYEPLAEEKQQSLSVQAEGSAPVRGDRDLLFQALANVIDNAIKYTPSGGRIEANVSRETHGSRIRVTDSGPGIPIGERQRVFQRFVRLEDSRSTSGNGLGLSLVAAVAKLHDAEIELVGDGEGLVVELVFPRPV